MSFLVRGLLERGFREIYVVESQNALTLFIKQEM